MTTTLALASDHVTFWWITLGLGAVVISAVIVLLFLLTQATNNRELYERNYGRLFALNMVVAGVLLAVILFGNLGYTIYRPEEFDDISPVLDQVSPAEVSLGNTIQLSAGMAIALNDRSAISFSIGSAFSAATHTTSPDGPEMRVPGSSSNSSTFNVGGTYALRSGWTLSSQATIGLTPDAPNFVMGLRASHTF